MGFSRELIDADAERVVRRLAKKGYKAYLVGGCVRDLLLERTPKDFDVATSATPGEIKQLFRNCRIIGRRFRLAHIFFGSKIIETSTFRANPHADAPADSELLIRRDNVFGSATEDAQRRDFTINGLFYDVEAQDVIDYVDGLTDLEARVVRTIGTPDIRFREDPVRMLRAVKFAARLGFDIEPTTREALVDNRHELRKCAPARVIEEFYRMARSASAAPAVRLLSDSGLLKVLSPELASLYATPSTQDVPSDNSDNISEEQPAPLRAHHWNILGHLDDHVIAHPKPSNSLILATVLCPFVIDKILEPGVRPGHASDIIQEVLQPIGAQLGVTKRDGERARQVLLAQRRLSPARRRRGRPMALLRRDYFDDALTIYELNARAKGEDTEDVKYWHRLKNGAVKTESAPDESRTRKRRRRRRGGRRRRRSPEDSADQTNAAKNADASQPEL